MRSEDIKGRAFSGFIWKFMEKAGVQILQIAIQIVLARLLLPEDYGLIGLLTIFIAVSDIFIQYGFSTGLIQRKDVTEEHLSSVFYVNMAMSILLYGLLFAVAPLVSLFYSEEQLTNLLRVLSLVLIIGASFTVHNAILSRELEFKKSFFRNIFNLVTQGVVGIACALNGFGVWSLVYSKLAGTIVGALVMYVTIKWHPKLVFSYSAIKSIFSFSSKLLGSYLLNCIYNNIHTIIIGRFFTKTDLGFYQRGQQIPQASISAIDGSLNEVLYAATSRIQDNLDKVKSGLRRSLKTSMFISLPILMGLFAMADTLTIVLLTEKWNGSIPFMRLACIMCCFYPLSARTQALNAIGKSGTTFKINITSKMMTILFMFLFIPLGIYAIMSATILAYCIIFFIEQFFVKKFINYSIKELAADLCNTIFSTLIMSVLVYLVGFGVENIYLRLVVQLLTGIVCYGGISVLFKNETLLYLLNYVKVIIK